MKRKNERKGTQTHAVSLVSLIDPSSPVAEQYRTIRTNIQFASSADQQLKTIVVTSSGPREGKSLSSANLAAVFAQAGQKTLLVDADLRKPTIHKTFQVSNEAGLSTLLSSGVKMEETVQKTVVENLFILTSGPKPPNPSELLGSAKMNQIMEEARNIFDIVIFDMPPVVTVTDAQVMSSKADGTLLVVRENWTRKDALSKAKELLDLVQARVLGVIYNGSEQGKDKAYYYYSD
ncbi:CpsD/CapB family tyrosine-protein kinase [Tetragenococcus halophilus]|uniref:CpsD/CapB family tyrosine-protein kinase n=1 Tax=Tetragenococcus halophilus TaxID=51669 RepID=UPI001B4E721E|nr:CpsD/CapB family tyrosine-protein kinase [Tetragenococcus halophilus]GFK21197.1 exopolysaccharide biosynthesis protein [Tetragenococcus halophilus]